MDLSASVLFFVVLLKNCKFLAPRRWWFSCCLPSHDTSCKKIKALVCTFVHMMYHCYQISWHNVKYPYLPTTLKSQFLITIRALELYNFYVFLALFPIKLKVQFITIPACFIYMCSNVMRFTFHVQLELIWPQMLIRMNKGMGKALIHGPSCNILSVWGLSCIVFSTVPALLYFRPTSWLFFFTPTPLLRYRLHYSLGKTPK